MNHAACRCGWVSDPTGEHGPVVQLREHARVAHGITPGVRLATDDTPPLWGWATCKGGLQVQGVAS